MNHELKKVTDGYVSYALVLKPVLLHLTFSLALAVFLRNPPSVSIKAGICLKAGATSVERTSAQSYIGFVVSAKQHNIHIVVGNFSISRNGCGSPCTDITTIQPQIARFRIYRLLARCTKLTSASHFFCTMQLYDFKAQSVATYCCQISSIMGPRRIVGGSADGFIARV